MECCIIVFGIVASLIRLGLTGITGGLTLVPCINSWVCPTCKIGIDFLIGGGQSLIRLGLTGITGGLTLVPCINSWVCQIGKIVIDLGIAGGYSLFDVLLKVGSQIIAVLQSIPCLINYVETAETAIGDLIAALGK